MYGKHTKFTLYLYICVGKLIRVPFLGQLVRKVAEWYGKNQHCGYILKESEAVSITRKANTIAVGNCACRETFRNCKHPLRTDIVFGIGFDVFTEISPEEYEEITIEEAENIIRDCRKRGLIQAVMKCKEDFYAICNCCPCCCVPLRLKRYGIKKALKRDVEAVRSLTSNNIINQ